MRALPVARGGRTPPYCFYHIFVAGFYQTRTVHKLIAAIVKKALPQGAEAEVVVSEKPDFGHYSTSVALRLAKERGERPLSVAEKLKKEVEGAAPYGFFEKVAVAPPGFINFWISASAVQGEFARACARRAGYGMRAIGKGKTVIVEYSQPNIAKKMHVGHLRTTVLGDALANVLSSLGYRVVRWNYLGDWGTQFGNLIAAYKLWGERSEVQRDPIATLLRLYVRFHDAMKHSPELEARGREEFQKLESGDRENRKLWEWFRRESLKEFTRVYRLLGVQFDVEHGESFFEKDLKPLVAALREKRIARESEGSLIVPLEQFHLPPALIEKSDGASLYLTRDIANLSYRLKKYAPAKILYVVGNEQSLHFSQLFAIAQLLGLGKGVELTHVKYGLVLAAEGKKFATREGRAVFLEEVAEKAIQLARAVVKAKNPSLSGVAQGRVARAVGIGALKYAILREHRHSDIVFDWGKMLDLKGDSAPYLQYAYARLQGILRKAGTVGRGNVRLLASDRELTLMRKIFEFPEVIEACARAYLTNILTQYLYALAALVNQFYETTPVLKDENAPRRRARLMLLKMAGIVLKRGLELLGISALPRI
ncbi:MAG: arginine--tRNA ligase [Candidatus Liptonbacteria bacterium]|nr:arginine--tRNA ligase [Candidatus Liptonbacteria bacterium]